MQRVLGKIITANELFNLIENGDKIAIGVSGGKDSMVLLYALSLLRNFLNFNFDIVGITLQLGFPDMDFTRIHDFCKAKNIEYHLIPTKVYDILSEKRDKNNKIQCSLCAKFKKGILINEAKKLACNKVAMAHHLDDGIETLFMNAIYNGYLASFKPKMYLDKENITFIRPLILCPEKDIISDALKNHLPIVKSTCVNDKKTSREKVKNWLNKDVYQKFPEARVNFPNMLLNKERVILWEEQKKD
jgi:tRNA(Ile)-lysidine synthase TilS/MesJ